jgi:hypothetical protein
MTEILWDVPLPPTQISNAELIAHPGRQCELLLETDEELGESERFHLVFERRGSLPLYVFDRHHRRNG